MHRLISLTCVYFFQIVCGDQATCKTIRGAKRWAAAEENPLYQLQWANETPGN